MVSKRKSLTTKLRALVVSTGVDTLDFPKKTDLVNLKSDVDKLDIDNVPSGLRNLKIKVDKLDIGKLETTPVDLNKN